VHEYRVRGASAAAEAEVGAKAELNAKKES
jgi:hypothetical protein